MIMNIVINPVQKELSVEYKVNCKDISSFQQILKFKKVNYELLKYVKEQIKILSARNKEIKKQIKESQFFFNSTEMHNTVRKFKLLQKKAWREYKNKFHTLAVYDEFNKNYVYGGTLLECQAYIDKQENKDYLTILP